MLDRELPSPEEVKRLIAMVLEGDKDAFARLMEPYRQWIYRFILSGVRHTQTAEDIWQEVQLAVWYGLGGYEDRENFSGWLFSIARKRIGTSFRRKSYQELPSDFPASQAAPDEEVSKCELIALCLQRASKILAPSDRELLALRLEKTPYAKIATLRQVSAGSLKKKVCDILKKLRQDLREVRATLGVPCEDYTFDAELARLAGDWITDLEKEYETLTQQAGVADRLDAISEEIQWLKAYRAWSNNQLLCFISNLESTEKASCDAIN